VYNKVYILTAMNLIESLSGKDIAHKTSTSYCPVKVRRRHWP